MSVVSSFVFLYGHGALKPGPVYIVCNIFSLNIS